MRARAGETRPKTSERAATNAPRVGGTGSFREERPFRTQGWMWEYIERRLPSPSVSQLEGLPRVWGRFKRHTQPATNPRRWVWGRESELVPSMGAARQAKLTSKSKD